MGINLARLEIRVLFEELIRRFPDMHVAPGFSPSTSSTPWCTPSRRWPWSTRPSGSERPPVRRRPVAGASRRERRADRRPAPGRRRPPGRAWRRRAGRRAPSRAADHTRWSAQTSSQWHGPPRSAHSDVRNGPSMASTICSTVICSARAGQAEAAGGSRPGGHDARAEQLAEHLLEEAGRDAHRVTDGVGLDRRGLGVRDVHQRLDGVVRPACRDELHRIMMTARRGWRTGGRRPPASPGDIAPLASIGPARRHAPGSHRLTDRTDVGSSHDRAGHPGHDLHRPHPLRRPGGVARRGGRTPRPTPRYCGSRSRGTRPFWAVTRHEDVFAVSRDNEHFLNTRNSVLGPDAQFEFLKSIGIEGETLIHMDGDEHRDHRNVANDWFRPRAVASARRPSTRSPTSSSSKFREMDGTCDFAQDIAVPYTLRVIMGIFGVPEEDEPTMLKLTQGIFGAADPEYLGDLSDPMALLTDTIAQFDGVLRRTDRGPPCPPDGRPGHGHRHQRGQRLPHGRQRAPLVLHDRRHGRPRHHVVRAVRRPRGTPAPSRPGGPAAGTNRSSSTTPSTR